MLRALVYIIIILSVVSCRFFNSSDKEDNPPIARVYDNYLYRSDLTGIGSGAARPEDSLLAVQNYVDSWIRHHLVLHLAQQNLEEKERELNDQLRDYRESLLIYLYEKELVNQKLDSAVSDNEIMNYYQEHPETFELKTSIAQVKYMILRKNEVLKTDSARNWIKKTTPYNFPKLRGFCDEYAVKYSISDSTWYNKDELASLFPADLFNLENALFSQSFIEAGDSLYTFLIKFGEFRIKGSDAPINFVRNEIKNIIMSRRKLEFMKGVHKSIYEKALKENDFEIYLKAQPDSL